MSFGLASPTLRLERSAMRRYVACFLMPMCRVIQDLHTCSLNLS